MNGRFEKKTAIVTGGTSGIGYATTALLLKEGGKVLFTGKSGEKLQSIHDQLTAKGNAACYSVACDISKVSEICKLAECAKNILGSIDFLFANAGIGVFKPFHEIVEDDFVKVIDTNLKGTFFTIQKLLPFITTGGCIVITASWTHFKGVKKNSVYSATKAALASLTKDLASELAEKSIRVNCISPGYINTSQFNEQKLGNEQAIVKKQQVTLNRFGTPEEVAAVVGFLASDASSYINGQEIVIDAGLTNIDTC